MHICLVVHCPLLGMQVDITLDDIHDLLRILINRDTLLVGHSCDTDLRVLRIFHTYITDTAALFAHPAHLPYKHALKKLAKEVLGREIQEGAGTVHIHKRNTNATQYTSKIHCKCYFGKYIP